MDIGDCHIGFALVSPADGSIEVMYVENGKADISGDAYGRYGSLRDCLVSAAAKWAGKETMKTRKELK